MIESTKLFRLFKDRLLELQSIWQSLKPPLTNFHDLTIFSSFFSRISEILDLRNQYDELIKLNIKPKEEDFFNLLKNCKEVLNLEHNHAGFLLAKNGFGKAMEPLDSDIIHNLRGELFGADLSVNPFQTLRDMNKWQGLLGKDNIINSLANERNILLDGLITYVLRIKDEFESRSGQTLDTIAGMESIPQAHGFSKVVNSITWERQLAGKIKRILSLSNVWLEKLKKFVSLKESIDELLKDMNDFEVDQFETWRKEVLYTLSSPDSAAALQLAGKLMDFDLSDGLLKINYSEKLILLLREVRQLGELGFRRQIPQKILDTVEQGKKFYKEALTLKQIANFYNTMSTQIIQSQKPMVIEQAMRFEDIVKSCNGGRANTKNANVIQWESGAELEKYIKSVQEAADEIMKENRKLRKAHIAIAEVVNDLFEIDLLRERGVWKEKMEGIRRLVENAVGGREQKLCRIWRIHWDYQLYKALEVQYQLGLMNLNQNLSEISAEVVMTGKNIVFRPGLEELKQK